MARVRYNVVPTGGWTHIAGPNFQAHVRLDRRSPLIASMSSAADEADLAAMSSLLADHPECAVALFQHQPTLRLLVRGQACVEVKGERHETFGPTEDDALLDVSLDWAVSSVRLDACNGRGVRDAPALGKSATTDHPTDHPMESASESATEDRKESAQANPAHGGPPPAQTDAEAKPPPLPAPPPDAWWLTGVREDPQSESPSPRASGADSPVRAAASSPRREPARWGHVNDEAASASAANRQAPSDGPPAQRRVDTVFVLLSDGTRVPLDGTVIMGRAPGVGPAGESSVTLEVTDGGRTVSRRHASIRKDRDLVEVRDLGSRNGTLVYVRGRDPISLGNGGIELVTSELPVLVALSPEVVVWLDVPSRSSD